MSEHKCMTSTQAAKWLLEYAKLSVDPSTFRKWLTQGRVRRCPSNPGRIDASHLKREVDAGRLPPQRGRKPRPEELGEAIGTLAESLTSDDFCRLHNGTFDGSLTHRDVARIFECALGDAGVECEIPGRGGDADS